MTISPQVVQFARWVKWFGLPTAMRLSCGRGDVRIGPRNGELAYPVFARGKSSDPMVYREVVFGGDYAPLMGRGGVDLILDLGANVGYAAACFLSAYPSARCVSVEPDADNLRLLRRNLAPFGTRSVCVSGGVWNRTCNLHVVTIPYRDGAAWSRQVEECAEGTPGAIPGFDIPTLLSMHGASRASILKVDIEGAEVKLFDESSRDWIDRVDSIVVELHDDSSFGMASPIFWHAIWNRGFRCFRRGELVFCVRG